MPEAPDVFARKGGAQTIIDKPRIFNVAAVPAVLKEFDVSARPAVHHHVDVVLLDARHRANRDDAVAKFMLSPPADVVLLQVCQGQNLAVVTDDPDQAVRHLLSAPVDHVVILDEVTAHHGQVVACVPINGELVIQISHRLGLTFDEEHAVVEHHWRHIFGASIALHADLDAVGRDRFVVTSARGRPDGAGRHEDQVVEGDH